MNKCLKNDLDFLLTNEIPSDDIESSHIYLDLYKKTKDEKYLNKIEEFKDVQTDDVYIKYPFIVGYDTIINKMHNYHQLIPELLQIEIDSLEKLFAFYKILTYLNQEMYDEYNQIRKYFALSIDKIYNKDEPLFSLLIMMAVSERFIDAKFLKLAVLKTSPCENASKLLRKYDNILIEKGIADVYLY